MTLTDTQVGEYVNVVDSYTNKTGARQVVARTANTITIGALVRAWNSGGRAFVGRYAGKDNFGYHTILGSPNRFTYIEAA